MRYKLILIFFLLLCAGAQATEAADQSRYRVEIIVLTHLEHDEQPQEAQALQDYSTALDFLAPAPEDAEDDGAEPPVAADPETADPETAAPEGSAPDGGVTPDAASDPGNVVVHVPELGEQMQDAWRRLRLSGPFRPLQYLAWEQGGDAPFPTLRLHDLEVILTQDPWAASRAAPGEAQSPGRDDGADLPPPVLHYRLDGTVSLTRSRFLHLDLAVELREPQYAPAANDDTVPADAPVPTSFLVHRLEQSRVVRAGRMEYFDGPVLGVLAWVTDISDSVAEEPAQ
jgi:hypothetical protein